MSRPVWNAIVQWETLMTLLQLPGMQVMHALVGCQKRWINSLARRFHSVDMMYSHQSVVTADATIRFFGAVSMPCNQLAVLVMDALNLHTVEAGKNADMLEYYTAIGRPPL